MAEVEEIVYTPEELEEIDRIVDLIDRGGRKIDLPKEQPVKAEPIMEEKPAAGIEEAEETEKPEKLSEEYQAAPETFEEPQDLELPTVDFEHLEEKKAPADKTQPMDDITNLIEEVSEEYPEVQEDAEPLEDVTGDLKEVPEAEEVTPLPAERGGAKGTALDELDVLTSEEPTSLDTHQMAPRDAFTQDKGMPDSLSEELPAIDTIEDIDTIEEPGMAEDLGQIETLEETPAPSRKPAETVSLGKEETEIPDLSEISFDEHAQMPEAQEVNIPDIDLGSIQTETAGPITEKEEAPAPGIEELTDEDFTAIKGIDDRDVEEPLIKPTKDVLKEVTRKSEEKATDIKREETSDLPAIEVEEPLEIEMLDQEPMAAPPKSSAPGRKQETEGGIDLSERDLNRLKKAIILFNSAVRQAVKNVVINDLLSPADTKQLINMILSGRQESVVHKYLEEKLGKKIPLAPERAVAGRRVLTSRPEYSSEGRARQKRLFTVTKIIGAIAAVVCVLVVVCYQFIYKPYMAKRLIREGTTLIRQRGDYLKKSKDYARAEELFRDVDENYVKDYLYGYTEFGRAYFDKKEYTFSIEKLNKIYSIQSKKGKAVDIDLLNSLGNFYSKVPQHFYDTMRVTLNQWYYPESGKKREQWSQLDVAIEFYRRVLLRDAKNITALYGIGNAYFYQGQYFKAKKYYEDIIAIEPDSEVGYSGLLNLYIDRDIFERVIDVHSQLTEKKLLEDVPSPLLAKLAAYYLDKHKKADSNVRIDYGVQSPRFKDIDDNIFPAVYAVLQALNKRDKDYPPLHLQFARLSKIQNNLKVMKIHLDKAIKLSLKNHNADYFGALHLMGEYFYAIKEPVTAYEFLNRAIKAADNPPEFTQEDFYKETESVGKSYALLGNIFYYYFDKIRLRYGDLEDETIEGELDKLANYNIARDKYEKAIEEGYESSEVHYNLGRVYYLNRLYQKALDQWLNLYEDFIENPELLFALGNAFYHMGNYDAAKGEYLKLISINEREMDKIKIPRPDLEGHVKILSVLSSSYNNVGAVYQIQNNEAKSDISYWKSIDNAQRINRDNEYARVNMARSFKKTDEGGEPILDESIPYSIEVYREEMRK